MPVTVSFVLAKIYMQGSVVVEEAGDHERAIELVRQMEPAELIEQTCEWEWDVDAWVDDPLPAKSGAEQRGPV